jgi:hypothetical protein
MGRGGGKHRLAVMLASGQFENGGLVEVEVEVGRGGGGAH